MRYSKKASYPVLGYLFFATLCIGAPTVFAQAWLVSKAGRLTVLKDIAGIKKGSLTKYITVKHFYADKSNRAIKYNYSITGRFRANYDLDLYIACPLLDESWEPAIVEPKVTDSAEPPLIIAPPIGIDDVENVSPPSPPPGSDPPIKDSSGQAISFTSPDTIEVLGYATTQPKTYAWLCLHFQKTLRNWQSDELKKVKSKKFFNDCLQRFNDSNFRHIPMFSVVENGSRRRAFRDAITSRQAVLAEKEIILQPEKTTYAERTGATLFWIFGSFAIASVIFILMLLAAKMPEVEA